jgi:hypothetical protein
VNGIQTVDLRIPPGYPGEGVDPGFLRHIACGPQWFTNEVRELVRERVDGVPRISVRIALEETAASIRQAVLA